MKNAFLLGLLLGAGGVLAGAYAYPWVDHPRLASKTSVVTNGGRAERFLIRLPADRIAAFGSAEAGFRARAALPEALAGEPLLLEHFKLRDVDGHVIGVAARHLARTPQGAAAAWALAIPGRGTLMLAGAGEAPAALDTALAQAGYLPGMAWDGAFELAVTDPETSRLVAASGEFEELDLRYAERWSVTGVDEDGELRATIELETVGRRRQP